MTNQTTRFLIFSLYFFGVFSCNGQSIKNDKCKNNLVLSRNKIYSYSVSKDTLQLLRALSMADSSLNCSNTRHTAIETKILIYMLLKRHQDGIKFVESTDEADFRFPYKKAIYIDFFRAYKAASNNDTANNVAHYSKALKRLALFMSNNQRDLTEETFLDWLSISAKIKTPSEIVKSIDSLKIRYPQKAGFLEGLKKIDLTEEEKFAIPIR